MPRFPLRLARLAAATACAWMLAAPGAYATAAGTLVLAGGNLALYPHPNTDVWDEVLRLAHIAAPGVATPRLAVLLSASASSYTGRTDYYKPEVDSDGNVTFGSYESIFTAMGFAPVLVPLALDNYASPSYLDGIPDARVASDAHFAEVIRGASVVFLNGGDQIRHVRALLRDDGGDSLLLAAIRDVLARGGIVVGTSAGSMAQSEYLFGDGASWGYLHKGRLRQLDAANTLVPVAYDRDPAHVDDASEIDAAGFLVDKKTHERTPIAPTVVDDAASPASSSGSLGRVGLNFLKGTLIDTHVGVRGRLGRLVVALTQAKSPAALAEAPLADAPLGLGVDENTALFVDLATRHATVLGEFGAFVADVSQARASSTSAGAAMIEGARVTYVTQGDAIDLSGEAPRAITTSKAPLGALDEAPQTPHDADAFGEYVTASMLTDLVTGHADAVTARAAYEDGRLAASKPKYPVRIAKVPGQTRGFRGDVTYATRDGGHATKTAVTVDTATIDLNVGDE